MKMKGLMVASLLVLLVAIAAAQSPSETSYEALLKGGEFSHFDGYVCVSTDWGRNAVYSLSFQPADPISYSKPTRPNTVYKAFGRVGYGSYDNGVQTDGGFVIGDWMKTSVDDPEPAFHGTGGMPRLAIAYSASIGYGQAVWTQTYTAVNGKRTTEQFVVQRSSRNFRATWQQGHGFPLDDEGACHAFANGQEVLPVQANSH